MQPTRAGDSRIEREFARARRHTVLVRALRVGLPLAAGAIVVVGLGVTWFARSLPDDISIASAAIADGGIVMEDPRMSGFDKNNRPYSMLADRAIQLLNGGGVNLEGVHADVAVGDDSTARIIASKGHYDQAGQKLRLSDNIHVATSDGKTIALGSADIDLKSGTLEGKGPVQIETDSQTISAGSLAVRDGGKGISFGQRVRMTIKPSAGDGRPQDLSSSKSP